MTGPRIHKRPPIAAAPYRPVLSKNLREKQAIAARAAAVPDLMGLLIERIGELNREIANLERQKAAAERQLDKIVSGR